MLQAGEFPPIVCGHGRGPNPSRHSQRVIFKPPARPSAQCIACVPWPVPVSLGLLLAPLLGMWRHRPLPASPSQCGTLRATLPAEGCEGAGRTQPCPGWPAAHRAAAGRKRLCSSSRPRFLPSFLPALLRSELTRSHHPRSLRGAAGPSAIPAIPAIHRCPVLEFEAVSAPGRLSALLLSQHCVAAIVAIVTPACGSMAAGPASARIPSVRSPGTLGSRSRGMRGFSSTLCQHPIRGLIPPGGMAEPFCPPQASAPDPNPTELPAHDSSAAPQQVPHKASGFTP